VGRRRSPTKKKKSVGNEAQRSQSRWVRWAKKGLRLKKKAKSNAETAQGGNSHTKVKNVGRRSSMVKPVEPDLRQSARVGDVVDKETGSDSQEKKLGGKYDETTAPTS